MKILFICCAGMSSSLIVKKLEDYLQVLKSEKKMNLDISIEAVPLDKFKDLKTDYNLILLAPQIGYKLKEFNKLVLDKNLNIPVSVIKGLDYGLLRVENILNDSLLLLLSQRNI